MDENQFQATAIVSGGVSPYSFEWNNGGDGMTTIISTNAGEDFPSIKSFSVTVTDNCGYQVIYQNSFSCNDICNEYCVELYKGGFGSEPGCTDVCDNVAAAGLEFNCDKIKVRCNCDDGVKRIFNWGSITGTTGTTTVFEGIEVISGKTSYDLVDSDGWAVGWVKNDLTGCVSIISTYIPEECFSLWNWFISKGTPLSGTIGDEPPSGGYDECISYTINSDDENCQTIWTCVDPPENNFPDIIDADDEFCQALLGYTNESIYHVFKSCNCDRKAEVYST